MQTSRTSAEDLKYGLAVSAAAFVLTMLAFEAFLRLTFEPFEPAPRSCGVYSPTLLWTTKPHCDGTNSRGYRDHEHTLEKDDGTFRIVILGDSVVQGHRIEDVNDTFGKVLERKLNEDAEDRLFETIHLARGGYTTRQELTILRDEALGYAPDLIVLNYVLNDPLNPVYHPISYNQPRYGFQSRWHQPTSHVVSFVRNKLFFVREQWKGRGCPDEYHRFLHCAYRDEIAEHLAELGEFSQQNEIPIVFVINPVYHKGAYKERYALADLHRTLAQWATAEGLIVYDLLDAYQYHDVTDVGFCAAQGCDVWHPSMRGHQVIADYLYGKLVPILSPDPETA